ncbi:ATP-binding protein [Mucilaginibacter sp. BT774]|uniref:AAA family ATPase n=1 Tax=Mucilaginibacter sp. BT774 TaxID=3062276 RepID=UPI0026760441|nr:ATP-binding protein [Mucilaginibacter sp. BT774]MDO3626214.1 ATP-binding protein [Mucilaginibacter sp. BT774]
METVIGRTEEKLLLKKIERSREAELLAVYGRRRIGKTFLIRNGFSKKLAFEFSGTHNALLSQALETFALALTNASGGLKLAKPDSWTQAFLMLTQYLTPLVKKERQIVFFDEFPWINSPRSGFLPAFEYFWNSWASKEKNLVVVICGSAASWMIKKVINNRGGLHNRVTRRIRLLPFTIAETAEYLRSRKIKLDRYQILQLYMAMGGIPQYLKEVEPGNSAAQVIDKLCFTKDGLLNDEFKNLYYSLFDSADNHISVIRALAQKGKGLSRNEIIEACKLTSGGYASQILNELSESGFITPYVPFGKTTKDSLYKLTDEYSLFYIKFIENSRAQGPGTWLMFSTGSSWKSWSGTAFESVCIKHIDQIKQAIGIKNVYAEVSVWRYQPKSASEQGAQIDMLIDRADGCINLCEMKFASDVFEISKSYAKELDSKQKVFQAQTKTRKTLFLTMMTTYGVKNGIAYPGLIQQEVTMDSLFNPL